MPSITQGSVTVQIPDHIPLPERAGKLSVEELRRFETARRGIGLVAEQMAEAMKKHPERLTPPGVDPAALAASGKAAEDIDTVIDDLDALLMVLKQANRILDADANQQLRRVLAFVRAQEKFDPTLPSLVPTLVGYFANDSK
jgi:hypothetical protein